MKEIIEKIESEKARAERYAQRGNVEKSNQLLRQVEVLTKILESKNEKALKTAKKYLIEGDFFINIEEIKNCVDNHEKAILKVFV